MAFAFSGCASLPPPTAELDAARQAVARADAADADQYAGVQIAQARQSLAQAQESMARGREDDARSAALAAAAEADLAQVLSRAAVSRAALAQQQAQVEELRERLQMSPSEPRQDPLAHTPPTVPAAQRLLALDADPQLNPFAQYERLQARQALAMAQAASKRDRMAAEQLAERRVGIAEQAARIEAAARLIDVLERERSELLVEASRRDAERARAEAERLRIEAQVQAEEAARLRAQAAQAEAVLDSAQVEQAARASAAREKQAGLARREAELVAGAPVPPSRPGVEGSEVFTLAGDAFASGQARLTARAAASVQALGTYLQRMGAASVQVSGHTDSQGEADANRSLSQARADAVRDGLAAAGYSRARIATEGVGEDAPVADNATAAGRARNRRVEVVVTN